MESCCTRLVIFRLEAIAQDAELEEFSKSELEQLGNELLTGCQKAQSEYEEKIKEAMKKPMEDGKKRQVWLAKRISRLNLC